MSTKYISQFKGEEIDERLAKIPSIEEDIEDLNIKIPSIEKNVEDLTEKIDNDKNNTNQIPSDWSQNDETKSDYIKNRTHYSEDVLLCDYTHTLDVDTWDGEEDYGGTFTLDKVLNPERLKLYVNDELVPLTYQTLDDNTYLFWGNIDDGYLFEYSINDNTVIFLHWIEKGSYKLYEENIVTLDDKYIADNIPRTITYEKELICQYTYNSGDFTDDSFATINVNKKLTIDNNLAIYVNGVKDDTFKLDTNGATNGDFIGYGSDWQRIYFVYLYDKDIISFYPEYEDGNVIQIYAENFKAIKDGDISNSIARTQYVDGRVDHVEEQIGDIDAALDSIIAFQESYIGGAEE